MTSVLYITYDGLCDPLGQSQVISYIKELSRKGVHTVILNFEKKERLKEEGLFRAIKSGLSQEKVTWKYLRYHNNPRVLATVYDILSGVLKGISLIKKHKIGIVHARGYVPAFIAFWLKRLGKIKFIFDMRGFWVEEKVDAGFWKKESFGYKIAKSWEKMILNVADRVVVLTQKAKAFLTSNADKVQNDVSVIPTCVDLDIFRPIDTAKKIS